METWKGKLREPHDSPYRLGYFENSEWMYEGQFKWHELHSDLYSFGGRYARFRYRHPFCVLENRATGAVYAMQMAYSGGYRFSFDFRCSPEGEGVLAFAAELDGLKPICVLAAGETVRSPEILLSRVQGDFDAAIQQMHAHIRNCYLPRSFRGGVFLESCGTCVGVGEDKKAAKESAAKGFDIYYRDADWFSEEAGNFIEYVGDWESNAERYPNGFRELSRYCAEIGIRCGLWIEPERAGLRSKRKEADREMFLRDEEDKIIPGVLELWFYLGDSGFYNLSKKEVCDRIEADICQVIEETEINFLRLDCNIDYYPPWSVNWENGCAEAVDFRYQENLYTMWERIRKKYPDLVLENCASGGGRTDLGMLRFFDHTWISDHHDAPRQFTALNGLSMCLPPEILTAIAISGTADTEYFLMLSMFTRPSLPDNTDFGRFLETYRSFAKPYLPTCRLYHHTPAFDSFEATGVGVLEAASEDGTKDMIGVFCNHDPGEEERTVRCSGVNPSFRYRVTDYRSGQSFSMDGYELKYRGLTVPLRGALTAELLMMEKE